ncbi:MAG: 23S rRNA (pseudouridine(1915)-N(3))-methyltransferase RlmH [Gemmatimonadetes bacterium]|nr:23S rRNA (pseudouridine(1915)-N(3))-methyltransferase RlmH [Gemmatimonadota bacterium]
MRVSVLTVGKLRALGEPIRAYERKAGRYWRLSVEEVPQAKGRDPGPVMVAEAARLQKRLDPRFRIVSLSRAGKTFSSVELARWMDACRVNAVPGVHFLIGGAFGLAPDLISASDLTLSLSSLTFPHDMARLVLAEQLYRAGTILRNEPYHKGAE